MKKGTQDKAQKRIITDFCSMTGASQNQAIDFLKRTNWNIQNSINLFFDQGAVPQVKQIKISKQITELFTKLSSIQFNQIKFIGQDTKTNIRQIEEQNFAQFINTYFQVNQENLIIAHILINIMKVKKSGHITEQNFYNLFQYLGYFFDNYARCENPKNLIKYVKKLEQQIYNDRQNFKNMYMNSFEFYLIGKGTMEYDTALQIWKLYFANNKNILVNYNDFIEYCQIKAKKPNRVHKDLWKMVYQFVTTVKNINKVKQDDGWPVFLDDFVEFLKDKYKEVEI